MQNVFIEHIVVFVVTKNYICQALLFKAKSKKIRRDSCLNLSDILFRCLEGIKFEDRWIHIDR